MTRRTIILAAVGALAIAAVGAAAYLRFWRAVPVATVEARQGSVALRVTGPGTMQARVPVTVSSRITASVRQVDADVGDKVERGQLLALLRKIARERASAVITVTHDHRMIEGFDTVYHLDDGRLTEVTRAAAQR